jgi:hypothetical protein
MQARMYDVKLTGETPLLMHALSVDWNDTVKAWQKDPANKKKGVAGDDRSPAWKWLGHMYMEEGLVVVPSDNLMSTIREGGAMCPVGKGNKTFKAQSQSGLVVDQIAWPVVVNGHTIPSAPFDALFGEEDFAFHKKAAEDHDFELFIKHVGIGRQKHIRVRPRFNEWSCAGTITVLDEMITRDVLRDILAFAGAYAGLCDWRPKSPMKPGHYGKFTADIKLRK